MTELFTNHPSHRKSGQGTLGEKLKRLRLLYSGEERSLRYWEKQTGIDNSMLSRYEMDKQEKKENANEPIELSAEETQIVKEMMEDNADKAAQEQAEYGVKEAFRAMKKTLKTRSKSQLIDVIWQYASNLQEMQEVAKALLNDNKELLIRLEANSARPVHRSTISTPKDKIKKD